MRFVRNRYSYKYISDEDKKKYQDKIPFRYIEKMVAMNGRGAIYDHPNYGMAIYKPVMAGSLDIYARPNKYFLYTANGQTNISVAADDPKLLLLQDNFDGTSFVAIMTRYAIMLGKIRETIVTNTHSMRTPWLLSAPKEQTQTVRMILEAVNEAPEVITDPNLDFQEIIKVVKTETPDNLKSLEDEYNTTFSKFKEEIGFASQNIDKKERLVAAEAEDDEGMLKAFDNEPYENRLLFVEKMESKFGIK